MCVCVYIYNITYIENMLSDIISADYRPSARPLLTPPTSLTQQHNWSLEIINKTKYKKKKKKPVKNVTDRVYRILTTCLRRNQNEIISLLVIMEKKNNNHTVVAALVARLVMTIISGGGGTP